MVCLISSHNQSKYILNIISSLEKQSILPKLIYFVFDRCEDNSIEIINKYDGKLLVDYCIKTTGKLFEAGLTRDYGFNECLKKYPNYKNFLFLDGDCIPNELVIEEHMENLNRIDKSVVSCGRRIQYDVNDNDCGDLRDKSSDSYFGKNIPNVIFNERNGKLLFSQIYHDLFIVTHSCNLAMNLKSINLCKSINKMLCGEERIFNNKFDGSWGCEDNFIGQSLFATNGFIFACSNKSFVEHKWHKTNFSNKTFKNMRNCSILLSKLKMLINNEKIYSDSVLNLNKRNIILNFDEILYSNQSFFLPANSFYDSYNLKITESYIEKIKDFFNDYIKIECSLKAKLINLFFTRNINVTIDRTQNMKLKDEEKENYKDILYILLTKYMTLDKDLNLIV